MDILMVAAELSPYASESEAGDALAPLSKVLKQLGHEVTVALPRHPGFEQHGLLMARRLTPLSLPGGREVTVFDGQLASGVRIVLFDAPELFERPGVFGEEGKPYPDNAARFGLLSRAAAALVRQRAEQRQPFDVVHLHDWPAALVPIALSRLGGDPVPTVMTIHDFKRQGVFALKELEDLGVPRELNSDAGLRLGAKINVLKGGLLFADVVTTPSAAYIEQLGDDERAGALAGFVRQRGISIVGVPNGVDYSTCNPATDPLIPSRYDAEDASNKGRCKTLVLRELELELETSRPLIAAAGDFNRDEGFDILAKVLPELLKNDLTLVIAGAGGAALEKRFAAQKKRFPETFAFVREPDTAAVHRLFAAADMLVVPTRHAPSCRSVMMAQRYGAVPIAHATGAVKEAAVDCDAALTSGTGFLFDAPDADALVAAVQRALSAYGRPAFYNLRRRMMRLDLSWDRPGRRFLQIYRQAIATKES